MTRASLLMMPVLLVLLLLGPASDTAWSLELEDGGLDMSDELPQFGLPELFEEVVDLEEELGLDVEEDQAPTPLVKKGGMVGTWQYTDKNEGHFHGRLFVKTKDGRRLIGWVKGFFKKTADGARELVGKIIDQKGKVRGVLKGVYGRRGFTARWHLKGGIHGRAKAKFVAPFGRAGFVGTFKVAPAIFDDEE